MRRLIAVLAVTVGSVLGFAQPASAHHTHSPTTGCNIVVSSMPGGASRYVITNRVQVYDRTGHPYYVNCYFYSKTTFQSFCRRFVYHNHGIFAC